MTTQIMPSQTASQQGEPDQQGDLDQQSQEKRSSIQKLKEQRNQYRQALELVMDRQNNVETLLNQVLEKIGNLEGKKSSGRLEDRPVEELEQLALNKELFEENPQNNLLAMTAMVKKLMTAERESIRKSVLDEVRSGSQRQGELNRVLGSLAQDFGPQAVDRNSELFALANEKYIALQRRYGVEKVNAIPDLMKNCFFEAAKELGQLANGSQAESQPRPSSSQPKPTSGPAPEDRVEGSGEGIADALSQRKANLQKGDWRANIEAIVKSQYPKE